MHTYYITGTEDRSCPVEGSNCSRDERVNSSAVGFACKQSEAMLVGQAFELPIQGMLKSIQNRSDFVQHLMVAKQSSAMIV